MASNPKRVRVAAALAILVPATSLAAPATYVIDPVHSSAGFTVKHLLSKVSGRFTEFSGTIVYDPANLAGSTVQVVIKTASVNTDNARRDGDLRSSNFFAADSFPTLSFVSTKVEPGAGDAFKVHGNLTMRGVTRPVVLDAQLLGTGVGMSGAPMGAWEAGTRVNRKDYGIHWSRTLDNGGVVVADNVDIHLAVEANVVPAGAGVKK